MRRNKEDLRLIKKHVVPYCIHTSLAELTHTKSKEVDITLDFKSKWIIYRLGMGARTQFVRQRIEQDKMYYMIIVSQSDNTEYKLTVD